MAYSEKLANRIRETLSGIPKVEEKKMFGGIAFMVNEKMCITVKNSRIMCRIDPDIYQEAVKRKGCHPVIMRDKEYKEFIYIEEEGIKSKKDFDYWISQALNFNKKIKY